MPSPVTMYTPSSMPLQAFAPAAAQRVVAAPVGNQQQGFASPNNPSRATAIPGYPSMARPMPQAKPAMIGWSMQGPTPQKTSTFRLDGIRVADPELIEALYILSKTENLQRDEAYLRSLGVNIMFHGGKQAIDVLRKRGVSIIFSDMGDSTAHAEWVSDMNLIKINQRYKDDRSLPTLYALSEAIYHEAGHAAHRGDDRSSIQEDVDCLALNAMAYRAHVAQTPAYPYFRPKGRLKPLFDNGVARYAQLFFNWDPYNPPTYQGSDPTLENLVHRIADKYGDLPPENPDHPIPMLPFGHPLALRICQELQRRFAEQSDEIAPINDR